MIAQHLGIQRHLVADRIRNAHIALMRSGVPNIQMVPVIPRRTFEDYHIQTSNITIISDLEMPDHSVEYLLSAVEMSELFGIEDLLLAGDGLSFDQAVLTAWAKEIMLQPEPDVPDVLTLAEQMMQWLLTKFKRVWWQRGNHDDRVAKGLNGQVNLGLLLRRLPEDRFTFIDRRKVCIETSRGKVWSIHPNGGGDAAKVAQDFYNKMPIEQKGHIVMPHFHVQVDTSTSDGSFEIHCIGCGRDKKKTEYLAAGAWRGRQWDESFIIIKDGWFYPFNMKNTNFDFYRQLLGC